MKIIFWGTKLFELMWMQGTLEVYATEHFTMDYCKMKYCTLLLVVLYGIGIRHINCISTHNFTHGIYFFLKLTEVEASCTASRQFKPVGTVFSLDIITKHSQCTSTELLFIILQNTVATPWYHCVYKVWQGQLSLWGGRGFNRIQQWWLKVMRKNKYFFHCWSFHRHSNVVSISSYLYLKKIDYCRLQSRNTNSRLKCWEMLWNTSEWCQKCLLFF